MSNEDGSVWVVFNGEIYNHKTLRERLVASGHKFASTSDTEVVVHLYEEHGLAAVEQLSGMFAFALWDEARQRLLLARDRLGIKPLYIRREDSSLTFASEVQALQRPDDHIHEAAITAYLGLGWVPGPRTIYEGIEELPAGHLLTCADGRSTSSRYASIAPADRAPSKAELGRALREAISRQLYADVPVGVFLSSGVDSAVVGRLAQEAQADVRALTVSFPGLPGDESLEARALARSLGLSHEVIPVGSSDVASWAASALASMDQPTVDGVNTWIIAKAVRERGIVVALSGLGGDELFAGYSTFRHSPRIATLSSPPLAKAAALGSRLASASRSSAVAHSRVARVLEAAGRGGLDQAWASVRGVFSAAEIAALRPDAPAPERWAVPAASRAGRAGVAELEVDNYLAFQLLRDADAMSMAHSLEVRVPLLDDLVVPLALGGLASDPDWSKKRLVEAVDPSLRWLGERSKQTFTLPFDVWIRYELRDLATQGLVHLGEADLGFDARALTRHWDDFLARRAGWRSVWCLAALGHWCAHHAVNTRDIAA